MSLRTVRVPSEMAGAFVRAEELVSRFFAQRRDDPQRGTIEIFGERYVLVRAASLSVEFFALVRDLYGRGREAEADAFARNILFDLAHGIGRSDARNFHAKMNLSDPIARLSAGPIHFAHAGWAFVDIFPESNPSPDESYCLVYDHPYSFESDAWVAANEHPDFPACVMNAGYSSGWCEESFGIQLVASEILCRAKGDDTCRFLMAHPNRIEAFVERYIADRQDLAPRMRGYQIPDLFARKRMEDELKKSHDELEQRVEERTAELKASRDRLEREIREREQVEAQLRQAHKLEAIGRLAGGIAHDFNNLMAVVIARGELLQRQATDPALRSGLEDIQAAAERAALLTRQLMAFGRSEAVERKPLSLNDVVAHLARTLLPLVGEDIELVTRLGDTRGDIEADRGQIEQIVMNLVVNARDAMPDGGKLTIETSAAVLSCATMTATGELAAGPYVLLSVVDSGAGMDETTLARIFDPFFTTKPDGKGTGLGLSIVWGIVRQSGGGIQVHTAQGRGSTFSIYFPRIATSHEPAAMKPAFKYPGGTETVLLVEDQRNLRAVLKDVLIGCGYTVLDARDPAEAIALAERAKSVDLLLTDVVMPKMAGPELARRLRADRPQLCVVLMSGHTPEGVFANDSSGRAAFLPKPFFPHELARTIREVLDGRKDR